MEEKKQLFNQIVSQSSSGLYYTDKLRTNMSPSHASIAESLLHSCISIICE